MASSFLRNISRATLFLAAASCATDDFTQRLDAVRARAPAPLVVAVDEVENPPVPPGEDALGFTGDLQAMIIENLRALDAASRVIPIQDMGVEAADVVIKPVLGANPEFSHDGRSSKYWASGLLWLATWAGGMGVADSSYKTDLNLQFDVREARTDVSYPLEAVSNNTVSLSFFDRNPFFSWQTLQSIVLPPFWTSDHEEETSRALTDRAVSEVALGLADFFKSKDQSRSGHEDGERKADRPWLEIRSPTNGDVLSTNTVRLDATIHSPTKEVTELVISVNGREQHEDMDAIESNERVDPVLPGYRLPVDKTLELSDGVNHIRLRFAVENSSYRTIRLTVQR